MLTQLTSRLASQLNDLTIQVVKEDWTLTSSPVSPMPSPSMFPPAPSIATNTKTLVYPLPNPIGTRQKGVAPSSSQPHSEALPHTHSPAHPGSTHMEGVALDTEKHKQYPAVLTITDNTQIA